ncbi:unnamed protein product [Adineta steineri]|uniref:Uncharacterized protein n=1 Tax=Adineta steineri TaxID=433720 RepID=A0A814FW52_9BILA|nr:unnamed protein product [Adineta steineri]CAF4086951.1 unnamed protein product [Adineta steineri]
MFECLIIISSSLIEHDHFPNVNHLKFIYFQRDNFMHRLKVLNTFIVQVYAMDTNQSSSSHRIYSNTIVRYPYLSSLFIANVHATCYVEQFLNESKTNLSCLTQLRVFYQDFTREETRYNCVNMKKLITYSDIAGSKDFHINFPLLNT